jgi:hypothetical protein
LTETELDPEVSVEDPEDPTSPRYPALLQLDRDWLLMLKKRLKLSNCRLFITRMFPI